VSAILTKIRDKIPDRASKFGALSDIMVARLNKLPAVVPAPVQPVRSPAKRRKTNVGTLAAVEALPRIALDTYLDCIYFDAEPVISAFNDRHQHVEYAFIGEDRMVTFQQVCSRTPLMQRMPGPLSKSLDSCSFPFPRPSCCTWT
jgi:hypothetical protein